MCIQITQKTRELEHVQEQLLLQVYYVHSYYASVGRAPEAYGS